jgi:hypothetical protein
MDREWATLALLENGQRCAHLKLTKLNLKANELEKRNLFIKIFSPLRTRKTPTINTVPLAIPWMLSYLYWHVFRGGRSGVDSIQGGVLIVHDDKGDKTSNTSEPVNSHSSGHLHGSSVRGSLKGRSREAAMRLNLMISGILKVI